MKLGICMQILIRNNSIAKDMQTPEKKSATAWLLFVVLCLIWGSSFVLMKMGMYNHAGEQVLSAYQVAALRMVSAGILLVPFAAGALRRLPNFKTGQYIFLSGLLGSFFPAFLFCMAETKIDSTLAGTANAMTPLFVLLVSTIVYKTKIPGGKWVGILLGFAGCLLLFAVNSAGSIGANWYVLLAVAATILYGINVNMVRHRLQGVGSLDIAAIAFAFLIPPALGVLVATGYFDMPLATKPLLIATGSAIVLGMVGTAIASVLFYVLVKRAGIVFSSLVTYGIPFVALGWGMVYGEKISALQMAALGIILAGVYWANRTEKQEQKHLPQ
jgi:drug/metabolite transporter (DMT)-like permease